MCPRPFAFRLYQYAPTLTLAFKLSARVHIRMLSELAPAMGSCFMPTTTNIFKLLCRLWEINSICDTIVRRALMAAVPPRRRRSKSKTLVCRVAVAIAVGALVVRATEHFAGEWGGKVQRNFIWYKSRAHEGTCRNRIHVNRAARAYYKYYDFYSSRLKYTHNCNKRKSHSFRRRRRHFGGGQYREFFLDCNYAEFRQKIRTRHCFTHFEQMQTNWNAR